MHLTSIQNWDPVWHCQQISATVWILAWKVFYWWTDGAIFWDVLHQADLVKQVCQKSHKSVIRILSLPVQVVTLISWYPYGWGKGRGGTLDLVTELILKWYKGLGNLTFDNWYTSTKLISLLTALDIPTTCTAQADHVGHPLSWALYKEKKMIKGTWVIHVITHWHCTVWNRVIT